MYMIVEPKRFARFLALIVSGLVIMGSASAAAALVFNKSPRDGVLALFYLSNEANVPALFSTLDLLLAAVLLAVMALVVRAQRRPFFWHWAALAAIFVYLGVDENCSVHELLVKPVQNALHPGGLFYYAWVIPGLLLVGLLALLYLKFFFHLPRPTAWLVGLAAVLYLTGAVGMEMLEGVVGSGYNHVTQLKDRDWLMQFLIVLEEGLEMYAIVLFNYALLSQLKRSAGLLEIRTGAAGPAGEATPAGNLAGVTTGHN